MEDKKVLGQFHAKISKAKILYDTTTATNHKLQRQAAQLQKQYEHIKRQRQSTQNWQKDAQQRMDKYEKMYVEQNQKCNQQTKQLNDARNTRKNLQRQKKICESDLHRLNLNLQNLNKEREQLQATAQSLSQKLDHTKAQKSIINDQYMKTQKSIQRCSVTIANLQAQIRQMRRIITQNTVPVHNVYENDGRNSRQKVDKHL